MVPWLLNARFTPNRDQFKADLQVEKFGSSWTHGQSLNFIFRSQASVDIDVSERLTYK